MKIKDILKQNDEALTESKEYSPQCSILWGPSARAWCVEPLNKEVVDVVITQAIVDSCEKELNITQNTKDLAEFAEDCLNIVNHVDWVLEDLPLSELKGLEYRRDELKKKWGL